MQFTLLVIMIVLTLISFVLLKMDPVAPGFLICLGFTFSVLCMCYNTNIWGIDTCELTVLVIVIGCVSFVIGNLSFQWIYSKRLRRASLRNKEISGCSVEKHNNYVKINRNLVCLVFIFDVFVVILYFIEVIKIAGIDSFTSMMYTFRQAVGFEGVRVSFVVNILLRVTKAFSTIFLYYFINNVMAGKTFKSERYLLWPFIPDLICGLLTGGRFRMLQLILGPIIIWAFLYFMKYGQRIKVSLKLIINIILIALLAMFLFYAIRHLVGRDNQTDIITYVTEYFGGPIELFDIVLSDRYEYPQPEIFGRNTFATFLGYISRFTGIYIGNGSNPGFLVSRTGINLGNVYTAYFKYYADFGVLGVFIISFINGCIWSSLYFKCLYKKNNAWRVIYAFVFHGLIFQFFDEMTYTIFLSIDNWMTFAFIIFFEKHIRTKVKL